jgi:hypothetical protein
MASGKALPEAVAPQKFQRRSGLECDFRAGRFRPLHLSVSRYLSGPFSTKPI